MGRFLTACFLLWATSIGGQEFRPMPDHRGQSFGLENFLMQPFNLAAQAEDGRIPPRRRDRVRVNDPYSGEFQVQGDEFDMKKIVPTGPRGPLHFKREEPNLDMKPVFEIAEPPTIQPPRIRQTHGEGNVGRDPIDRRRILPPVNNRRPLERPSEFQLTAIDGDQQPPERHRKRVMKRRRKKPSTPLPELVEEKQEPQQTTPVEKTDDNEPNSFKDDSEPEVHKTSFYIEHTQEVREENKQDADNEVQQIRRKSSRPKVQNESKIEVFEDKREEIFADNTEDDDKVVGEATMTVIQQELPAQPVTEKIEEAKPTMPPTTETPQEPTHRLKTLLKQQNGQLSLSELLQTQNLSLADFLKGNPGALSALGATKASTEKSTPEPEIEKQKFQPSRSHVPKISPKSRPFSKASTNSTKPPRKFTTEETIVELPKKLDIIEVTSDRPTYNGFAPKNPRTRGSFHKQDPKLSVLKDDEIIDKPKTRGPFHKHEQDDETIDKPKTRGPFHKHEQDDETIDKPKTRGPFHKHEQDEETIDKPKARGPFHKQEHRQSFSKETLDDETTEDSRNTIKQTESDTETKDEDVEIPARSTLRPPVYRLTTIGQIRESTIGEHRIVPKRYGDYKPKLRIDRRKPTTEVTTDATTILENQEMSKISSTTEEIKATSEPKNRVRIPFMSVNNPEISVILPSKKQNISTSEKPRERFHNRERLNLFKRINPEERQSISENTLETKAPETTEAATTTQTSSSTTTTRTTEWKTHRTTTEALKIAQKEIGKEEEVGKKETSDEIVELLKTGNNAQRLERILATRNMTLDELLEKRARSSKQPNVTHLFENQTDPELTTNEKVLELSDNFHPSTEKTTTTVSTIKPAPILSEFTKIKGEHVGRPIISKPNAGRHHESNSFDELFVDESIIRPIKIPVDKEEPREPKAYDNRSNKNSHRVQLNLAPGTEGKPKHPMPIWNVDEKSIYNTSPYGYPTYDLNKNLAGNQGSYESSKKHGGAHLEEEETPVLETAQTSLDRNQNLKNNINEILKEQIEVVKEVHEEKTFIPPAVKSAIIASGVVMGIALVVFVAIFAACGWKQRQFRLRARSSILDDSLSGSGHKVIKRTGTLSPISFKRTALYKKSIEFEDSESSISGSSNTSSYLWNTLKHTFQSRNSTLKNRQEKEEKIQERENRSRRNTLTKEDDRRRSLSRDDHHRDSLMLPRDQELPRRNTLTKDDFRRDSMMSSRREFSRDDTRRSSGFRDDTRRLNTLMRDVDPCKFTKIDPDRNIIQTSVNFKRGGYNGSSRHFDSCDHFN